MPGLRFRHQWMVIAIRPRKVPDFPAQEGLRSGLQEGRKRAVGKQDLFMRIQNQKTFGHRIQRGAHTFRDRLGGIQLLQHFPQIQIKTPETQNRDKDQ